ncbi:Beta-eliminating lyase family protein [Aspergillus niger]|uniref:Beta-eliminating lyase family protein n=1 Tax=Aspergillus niger TaxID=5061 RepID=A0A505HV47_ASPNG|nr:Beta-eliminating lyase family protein [Aspergillus niger]
MSSLVEVASEAEFPNIISSIPPSCLQVLYFHAPWAAPCAQMRAVISALASQYPATNPPSIAFLSVNAEELPDISEEYNVTAVPFVVLVRDNKILETISGKNVPATATQAPATNGNAAAPALTPEQSKEALFARLAELVKAAPVMLFMKGSPSAPQCGFSRQIVGILRERSVKYGFFNILADEDVRQGLKEFADWPTFPQLWVEGELVGGLDIVKEELENDPEFLDRFSVNKPAA